MKKILLACACVGSLALSSTQSVNAQTMVTQSFRDFKISDPYYGGETMGAMTSVVLSPTPPVECLSTLMPGMGERSTITPL